MSLSKALLNSLFGALKFVFNSFPFQKMLKLLFNSFMASCEILFCDIILKNAFFVMLFVFQWHSEKFQTIPMAL